jgi:glyoxylase-like metal-dependent hydrolase (beta-lactamase superfamily II)
LEPGETAPQFQPADGPGRSVATLPGQKVLERNAMRHHMRQAAVRAGVPLAILAGCALALAGPGARAAAQTKPAPPPTVRMYVFDCGVLKIADPMQLFGLRKDEVGATDLSDAAYLIVHPRGTLMWEAGLVPDANIGAPNARPGAPARRLKDLMADVGYKPSDITYFAISHGHGDHTANANDFTSSTWLVSKAEYDAMFLDKAPRFYTPATYAALKNARTMFIGDNYDVFGDGSAVIKQTPGHTPGHQVLFVRMKNTGTVALTGDLYHYPEEVGRREVAPAQGDQEITLKSRAEVDAILKKTGGQMWITHDLIGFSKLKKAPAFYD